MTSLFGYHKVASAIRFYKIPNSSWQPKGKPILGFEASESLPAWQGPSREEPYRDEGLRELVDRLPAAERHVVERVHFGQSTLRQAAIDAGISPAQASHMLARGLEILKGWLTDPDTAPTVAPKVQVQRRVVKEGRCGQPTPFGKCKQVVTSGLCGLHAEMRDRDIRPDPEYHRKVVSGEKEPIQSKLSATEMESTINGRYKGDGRRLDQWVTEPLGFEG
ncbi:MAG: sigma-70 family RNA polymerase sigma factor [Gemmatimonadaceae bacterium]|nr:sigma-70 family RNA polymerase sigma factor [Gemmatimonadaceae bacterium]